VKIGIISDTHNQLDNLRAALAQLKTEGVGLLIHCGDATRVEMVQELAGFKVAYLFGNGDFASGEMAEVLRGMNSENYAGLTYTSHIDGVAIAATHGHMDGQVDQWLRSRRYDFVIQGHSHRRRDVRVGNTRHINPGALGGLQVEAQSFAVLDLQTHELKFIKL
jgi:putative phosphoesterase